MAKAESVRLAERRYDAMGLVARPLPEGGGSVFRLPVSAQPFEGPSGSFRVRAVWFAAAGRNRIKCVVPRVLFHLPLLDVTSARSPVDIEARIRVAWRRRMQDLEQARSWLSDLGCRIETPSDAPVLRFPLGTDDPDAWLTAIEPERVILPGVGPLEGAAARRAEDRLFRPDPSLESSVDLELAACTRLEALARMAERLDEAARRVSLLESPPPILEARARRHPVLVVGPKLRDNRALLESLRARGYRLHVAASAGETLGAFQDQSFELVLADADLGRYEGLELIPSLRSLPGLEEVPLVLVDSRERPERREAARRLGAAGYLVHPVKIQKIERGLARLTNTPRRRRFTRYPRRLPVRWAGCPQPELTTALGRGGMFVTTGRDIPIHALDRYEIALPGGSESVRVDAEVVYRHGATSTQPPGLGLRFHTFPDGNESLWIDYLQDLEGGSGAGA